MTNNPIISLIGTLKELAGVALARKPPLSYVGGWTGKRNLGDEILYDAAASLFSTKSLIQYRGGRLAKLALDLLPGLTHGVLAGGTLIGQKGLWLDIASEFQTLGRSLVVFGTGVEESSFWPGDPSVAAWRPILDRCPFIGVRGPISAQKLYDIGCTDVKVVGDPVIAFALEEANPAVRPNSLGLNVSLTDGRLFGGDESRVAVELANLARIAKQNGWIVEWFVVWPKDLELTRRIAYETGTGAVIHEIFEDHKQFLDKVSTLSAFVGMKLHATLLATCAFVPSVMIEYRPKCRDYMQSIGQETATIRSDQLNAGLAWELVNAWNHNRNSAVSTLQHGIRKLKAQQSSFRDEVLRLHLMKH
jgi:polysaccharide pyruvyl transferase WcaK-like protein